MRQARGGGRGGSITALQAEPRSERGSYGFNPSLSFLLLSPFASECVKAACVQHVSERHVCVRLQPVHVISL